MIDLDKRREMACDALATAVMDIAQHFSVCPVCLSRVVADAFELDADEGKIMHFDDTIPDGTTVQ